MLFGGVQCSAKQVERMAHAETKAAHAKVMKEIADKTGETARLAALARDTYDDKVTADAVRHAKEIDHAFERGRKHAADIAAGDVRVRTVWRNRECPQAVPGSGAEPDARIAGFDSGRAEAIGRVLGLGSTFDAEYNRAIGRVKAAQTLIDACYEQPANP